MNPGELLVLALFAGLVLWAFTHGSGGSSTPSRPVYRSLADVLAAAEAQGYAVLRPDSRFEPDEPIADMLAEARTTSRSKPANERQMYTIVPSKELGRAVVQMTMPGAYGGTPGKPVFEVLTVEAAKPASSRVQGTTPFGW